MSKYHEKKFLKNWHATETLKDEFFSRREDIGRNSTLSKNEVDVGAVIDALVTIFSG